MHISIYILKVYKERKRNGEEREISIEFEKYNKTVKYKLWAEQKLNETYCLIRKFKNKIRLDFKLVVTQTHAQILQTYCMMFCGKGANKGKGAFSPEEYSYL